MINLIVQQDTVAAVDTLTKAYGQKWHGTEGSNPIITAMASHDLIFIVLGVTLIIWFILLFFLIRLDRKVQTLEKKQDEIVKSKRERSS